MGRRMNDINWTKVAVVAAILVLLWLMLGCGRDNVRVEYVEKLVPVQSTLTPELLETPNPPPAPKFSCVDSRGAKTVCTEDALDWGQKWEKIGRDLIEQIKKISGLQPDDAG